MLYAFIALPATALGAIIGVGGGLVIRPVLAFLKINQQLAAFTSSITVLVMAVVTLLVYKKQRVKIEVRKTGFIAGGSIAGGFIGGGLIPLVPAQIADIGYIVVLAAVVLATLGRNRLRAKKDWGRAGSLIAGGLTGILSGFFGIGGGPFQMAALMIGFKMNAREAAVQSIFITLLTTISALARYGINGAWDFSIAVYMIPSAVVGGLVGGFLNRRMKNGLIRGLFLATLAGMIVLQCVTVASAR